MKVICSFCRTEILETDDTGSLVSHGMCRGCADYFQEQWRGIGWDDYLSRFPFPVVIVDGDVRLLAANREMESFLGRKADSARGLLGGEAMECVYARLPEGCGRTEHCAACAIRITVNRVHQEGEPSCDVHAYLQREDSVISLKLSAYRVLGGVALVVEEYKPGA